MRGGTALPASGGLGGRFQSTRPMRGGTPGCRFACPRHGYFNPPAPCGAGLVMSMPSWSVSTISIHPPRAGRDNPATVRFSHRIISIHPPRAGRDLAVQIFKRVKAISIHPPRAGRDHVKFSPPHFSCNFNPPAPCGAGPGLRPSLHKPTRFQSTRPMRGGTRTTTLLCGLPIYFNPPAPCGAGRHSDPHGCGGRTHFNPPAPCGAGP